MKSSKSSDPVTSDEALVQITGKGNLEAFEEIVRRHQNWAWQIVYRFFGDINETEDIVQESFLRVLDAANRYKPTAKFRTYFYQIIIRLCLDRAKKQKPLYMKEVPEVPDPSPGMTDKMMRRETNIAVRAALDTLPPNQRMAIVLRYYEELNYKDIASALGTTSKAVERLLARGRERLRSILDARNFF